MKHPHRWVGWLALVYVLSAPTTARAGVEIELYAIPWKESPVRQGDVIVTFEDAREADRGGGDLVLVGRVLPEDVPLRSPGAPVDEVVPTHVACVLRACGVEARAGHDPGADARLHVVLRELWGEGDERHRATLAVELGLYAGGEPSPVWRATLRGEGEAAVVLTDRERALGYERAFADAGVALSVLARSRVFRQALSPSPGERASKRFAEPTVLDVPSRVPGPAVPVAAHPVEDVAAVSAGEAAVAGDDTGPAPGGWEAVTLGPGATFAPPVPQEYDAPGNPRTSHVGFLHGRFTAWIRTPPLLAFRLEQAGGFSYDTDAAAIHWVRPDIAGEEPLVWGELEWSAAVGGVAPLPSGELRIAAGPRWAVERLDRGIERHLEQDLDVTVDHSGSTRMAGALWFEIDGEIPRVMRMGPRLGLRIGGMVATVGCDREDPWTAASCDVLTSQVRIDQLLGFAWSFPAGGPVAFVVETVPILSVTAYGEQALRDYEEVTGGSREAVVVDLGGWIHAGVELRLGQRDRR